MRKDPPPIEPATVPGPSYDPIDWIVQDMENIESFLAHLSTSPSDIGYFNDHFHSLLPLMDRISGQIDRLGYDPYNYSPERLQKLHHENARIFMFVEGVEEAMKSKDEKKLKKRIEEVEEVLSTFDDLLTP